MINTIHLGGKNLYQRIQSDGASADFWSNMASVSSTSRNVRLYSQCFNRQNVHQQFASFSREYAVFFRVGSCRICEDFRVVLHGLISRDVTPGHKMADKDSRCPFSLFDLLL